MDNGFLIKFATRNLLLHKLRTFLTILAMIIGVGAIVFLVAFAFGIQGLVEKEVTGGNAYRLVDVGTGNSQIISLNKDSVAKISGIPNIKNTEAIVNAAANANGPDNKEIDLSFFGTTENYLSWLSQSAIIGDTLTQQSYAATASNDSDSTSLKLVINASLAKALGYSDFNQALGKKLKLVVILTKDLTADKQSKTFENEYFTISGVIKDADSPAAYLNLNDFLKYSPSSFSQTKVEVSNQKNVDATRKQIENLGFKTQYLGETIDQVNQVFNFFKVILGSFGLIALVVAVLGMFNTLTISLLERTKEVALLKIIGMKRKEIKRIFLLEATIISFFGSLLGILLGYLGGALANHIINNYSLKAGGDTASLFSYPVWFILTVFAITMGIGLLTGFYPARRAARVNALDVLRYE